MRSVSPQNSKNKVVLIYNPYPLSLIFILYLSSKENVETWILPENPVIPGIVNSRFHFKNGIIPVMEAIY